MSSSQRPPQSRHGAPDTHPAGTSDPPATATAKAELVLWGCVVASGALAFLLAWQHRYYLNPDGLSYIDIATNAWRHGPRALLNPYWSPLYPALIALFTYLFRPERINEFPMVHLLNWFIFLAATVSFAYFLRSYLKLQAKTDADKGKVFGHQAISVLFFFSIFYWSLTTLTHLKDVTPDLCVAVIVFLVASLCCRLAAAPKLRHYVLLGVILGIGYYVKAALFPISVALLLILFVFPPKIRHPRRKLLLSLVVFLAVCTPLVWYLSSRLGRPTIGDAGKLNYAWYVNGVPRSRGWIGKGGVNGIPVCPPRVLVAKPLIFEFRTLVAGTYPLWYDPSYWHQGLRIHLDLKQQIRALGRNARVYARLLLMMAPLVAGLLALVFYSSRKVGVPTSKRWSLWVFLWSASVCSMYALVHTEGRFVAPFVVLIWVSLYTPFLETADRVINKAVLVTVLMTITIPLTAYVARDSWTLMASAAGRAEPPRDVVLARELKAAGVRAGDRIAVFGDAFHSGYAWIAGVKIIAEAPYPEQIWESPPPQIQTILNRLRDVGVKAIVATDVPPGFDRFGWQPIYRTGTQQYGLLVLDPAT